LNVMQAIICASNHRVNVLGQYRQTQHTNSQHNSNSNHNTNTNTNTNNSSQHNLDISASDICTGPFHNII